ncbi:MAG: Fe(2+)-trafficking protein [bacterium]
MDQEERIEQFRKMAKANPDDDLAHYALGQALVDMGRHAEAANVLRHVIRLNAGYSRAYVLLGIAQQANGDEDGAIETFQRGYAEAMNRGDLMPATEMKQRLGELGAAPDPERLLAVMQSAADDDPDAGREPGEGEVRDARTGRIGKAMSFDPFGDALGAWIQAHISQESWEAWMEMSIKVINELRLDLGDPMGQKAYDDHMRDFLNMPPALFEGRGDE